VLRGATSPSARKGLSRFCLGVTPVNSRPMSSHNSDTCTINMRPVKVEGSKIAWIRTLGMCPRPPQREPRQSEQAGRHPGGTQCTQTTCDTHPVPARPLHLNNVIFRLRWLHWAGRTILVVRVLEVTCASLAEPYHQWCRGPGTLTTPQAQDGTAQYPSLIQTFCMYHQD
jgi:hypothetical protein